MSFVFKNSQEIDSHALTLSHFLKDSSNFQVEMNDLLNQQLMSNIQSILNSASEETIIGIILALKNVGLETLSDLEFVQEEDLMLVLKPIQRRKLIKAWSKQKFPLPPPLPTQVSSKPLKYSKWKKKHSVKLLELYVKYKTELSCPRVNKHEVWQKIIEEMQQTFPGFFCDNREYINKIENLKLEYELLKREGKIPRSRINVFISAKNAFETDPDSVISTRTFSSSTSFVQESAWKKQKFLLLLRVYAAYKAEFLNPNIEEQTVWKKIALEVGELGSILCDELECCNKIKELRIEYENIKNKETKDRYITVFLDEAKKAFEITENSGPEVNETSEKIGKYVPPHLRNGENKQVQSILPTKTEDRTFTTNVSNLSKDLGKINVLYSFNQYSFPIERIGDIDIIKDIKDQ